MKTLAPLPSWRDFAVALLGPVPNDDALSAAWRSEGSAEVWFSRGAWAFSALVEGWKASHDGVAPRFWLPDYFCNQSTAPIRDAGARLQFYPVGTDLEPKWDMCRQLAETGPPDVMVLVHYFGRAADGATAREFCDETGALLLEDAAHVVKPFGGIGTWGDAILYCPHKIVAAPDGALLLLRSEFPFAVAAPCGPAPSSGSWLLKRALQKLLPGEVLAWRRRMGPGFGDDPLFQSLVPTAAVSSAARRLLARAGRDLATAAEKRRQTARTIAKEFPHGECLFGSITDGELAPYRLVFRFGNPDQAAEAFARMRQDGRIVETWPDLPPEVFGREDRHTDALHMRRTQIFVPVHG